jgi:hypothetical protein
MIWFLDHMRNIFTCQIGGIYASMTTDPDKYD